MDLLLSASEVPLPNTGYALTYTTLGYGKVVNLHEGEWSKASAVKMFNFSEAILDTIVSVPIRNLPAIRAALSGSTDATQEMDYLQLFEEGFDRHRYQ